MRPFAIATAVLLISLGTARAGSITVTYDGTVTSTGGVPTFAVGNAFQVTFTYDPSIPNIYAPNPNFALYYQDISALSFTVGTYAGSEAAPLSVEVGYDDPDDYYCVAQIGTGCGPESPYLNAPQVDGYSLSELIVQLDDPTATALTSDAIPLGPLNPAAFGGANSYMALNFQSPTGGDFEVSADYTSSSAPEPGTAGLLGLGLFGFSWYSKRKGVLGSGRAGRCRRTREGGAL